MIFLKGWSEQRHGVRYSLPVRSPRSVTLRVKTMKRKDNRKRTFIIGAIIIAFFVSLPFLYKALLYGAAYVLWGFMAYFVGNVPLSEILSWWTVFPE